MIAGQGELDLFYWVTTGAKVAFLLVVLLQVVPIMAWVERRGMALMQMRLGPNRIGPLGLFQSLADAVKFIMKEDRVPQHVTKFYWFLAPLVSLVPSFMTFAVIPLAAPVIIDGRALSFQVADLNVGLLYVFAVASLGVYGIIMAGWASNNKYSLLGALRSSSQMISYELSMGLSVVGLILCFQSVSLGDIATAQTETLLQLGPIAIPSWGIFIQPLGFLLFLVSVFAETNRTPFDLPEGESEIVAGYFLEYGSMKFALFMMAEYLNMFTASGLLATLYFGGWHLPGLDGLLAASPLPELLGAYLVWAKVAIQVGVLFAKVGFFMWFFVWVRWTVPRFRYDQLMDLGWRVMLPLSLANVIITAGYLAWRQFGGQ